MHRRWCVGAAGAQQLAPTRGEHAAGEDARRRGGQGVPDSSPDRSQRSGLVLCGLLALGSAAGCEAVWGSLSVPAAENCVAHANLCEQNQVCDPVTQLCQDKVTLTQVMPAHGRTSDATAITLSGTHFVPGMSVTWNGVALSQVTVDSATQLRFTAPPSADGSWRVTIAVGNPSGAVVSRSDLFSYYSTEVSFQQVVPTGVKIESLFTMRVVPPARSGRAVIAFADTATRLRGLALSSDSQTFTEQWTLSVPNPRTLLVGDLDGDGIRDLMMASDFGFFWLAGNADSSLQSYMPLRSNLKAFPVLALGDLDNDGSADLVGVGPTNQELAILSRRGTQYATYTPPGKLAIQSVVAAELDGQPGDDVAVAYEGQTTALGVIHGGATVGSYPDVSIPVCLDGQLRVGRFGDGTTQSLVLTCRDRVQVLQAAGGGAFTPGFSWPVALDQQVVGSSAQLGDFDGDGDLDLLVVRTTNGEPKAELWLLENSDGRGTFLQHRLAADLNVSRSSFIDIGDLNDDGKPDVAIGDQLGSMLPLTVLLNRSR